MKDKLNLFALVVATLSSIAVVFSIAAKHYVITTVAHLADVTLDAMRTVNWPDL